ncbi:hypothetical protein HDE_11713 [Halotydeus destructor]|nr:hypothetical protein HDE_11713 [Halotydeus destructor]
MGMSQNPIPSEGYISILPYETLNSQHMQASQPPLMQQQFVQYDYSVPAMQEQTLVLLSPASANVSIPPEQKSSPMYVLTDMHTPQGLIQFSTPANIIQLPNIQAPSGNVTFLDVPQNNMTMDASANNVNLVQVPSNLLLNNNVILCLQPQEAPTYQFASNQMSLRIDEAQVIEDTNAAATAMAAKSWHMDSDIANRALKALEGHVDSTASDQSSSMSVNYSM